MKTIKVNCEFASELVCVIPYVYWLHQNNQLKKVITSKGMKPFYYFCDDIEERYEYRTFDLNTNGLKDVPNNWVHHNSEVLFNKDYSELSDSEKAEANGVLDYSKWTPPPYKKQYETKHFDNLKPYIIVNNNFNIESANDITESRRYFNLNTLSNIFYYLQEVGYNVIYKRPDNTEFAPDQNEMATLQGGHRFSEMTDQGTMSDYGLCDYYDNVYNLNQMDRGNYGYNEFQMKCFTSAEGFITSNGGGGVLCSYFEKPVLFYVPSGKELRPGYLTKQNSYIKKLSNSDINVVIDKGQTNDYSKLLNEMRKVFK